MRACACVCTRICVYVCHYDSTNLFWRFVYHVYDFWLNGIKGLNVSLSLISHSLCFSMRIITYLYCSPPNLNLLLAPYTRYTFRLCVSSCVPSFYHIHVIVNKSTERERKRNIYSMGCMGGKMSTLKFMKIIFNRIHQKGKS